MKKIITFLLIVCSLHCWADELTYYTNTEGQYDWNLAINDCIACKFNTYSDFGITNWFRIHNIGQYFKYSGGIVKVYCGTKDADKPCFNSSNNFEGAEYCTEEQYTKGDPYNTNFNIYPNWKYPPYTNFWLVWHLKGGVQVNPYSDKNRKSMSMFYEYSTKTWKTNFGGKEIGDWYMFVLVAVYPTSLESTSFGIVKALFR